jgi:hypothetical protein
MKTTPALHLLLVLLALLAVWSCTNDDARGGATAPEDATAAAVEATPQPTPARADAEEGTAVFNEFVRAVQEGRAGDAWRLYAASLPDPEQHREDQGCSYTIFAAEFPLIQNLFARAAPFQPLEYYGTAAFSPQLEIIVQGADGNRFLVTLLRVEPHEPYRLRFLNSGRAAAAPGVPDPLPSPGEPRGFCGIWAGPR